MKKYSTNVGGGEHKLVIEVTGCKNKLDEIQIFLSDFLSRMNEKAIIPCPCKGKKK